MSSAVELLIKAGARLNDKNSNGFTALYYAKNNPVATQLLLDHGAVE